MSFLHSRCISGPVQSRRLGLSLGINLLPCSHKICNYNCVYCECGWNTPSIEDASLLPLPQEVSVALEAKLEELKEKKVVLGSITFSGNGEPSLHPHFLEIMKEVIRLRGIYFPHCPVCVISNATRIHLPSVEQALGLADDRLLKLDAGTVELYGAINGLRASPDLSIEQLCCTQNVLSKVQIQEAFEQILLHLNQFPYPYTLQTLFFRGKNGDVVIDNTQGKEWDAYLEKLQYIQPSSIMIYGLDRETPGKDLEKISEKELKKIAQKLSNVGWARVQYYY